MSHFEQVVELVVEAGQRADGGAADDVLALLAALTFNDWARGAAVAGVQHVLGAL